MLTCEVERVLGNAVVVEHTPVALKRAREDALGVLVQEAEEVKLDGRVRAQGRADITLQVLDELIHVQSRVVNGRVRGSAVRGPSNLAEHDGHVRVAGYFERRVQSIEAGIKRVFVSDCAVHDRACGAVEEGVADRVVRVLV